MKVVNIMDNNDYLYEYFKLCKLEWGSIIANDKMDSYIKGRMINLDNVITVLGLVDNDCLIGFISLLKSDGDIRKDLSPWYATMYVKSEFRGKGYSRILNNSILDYTRNSGYKRIYLKTDLVNYYEKFGFKYMEKLDNKESLYYLDL